MLATGREKYNHFQWGNPRRLLAKKILHYKNSETKEFLCRITPLSSKNVENLAKNVAENILNHVQIYILYRFKLQTDIIRHCG